jgi:hypothetical protein
MCRPSRLWPFSHASTPPNFLGNLRSMLITYKLNTKTSLPERNSRPSLFAPQYSRIRRFALRNRDTFSHAGYGIPSATGSLSPIKYNRSSIDQLLQHTWATNSLDFRRNISLTPWMHDCSSKHENERQRDLPISGKQVIRIVLQLQRTVLPINARTSSRQVISCRLVSS